MLKRDVEMITRIIRTNAGNRRKLAEAFAMELGQIVSAFDRVKFLKACGVRQILAFGTRQDREFAKRPQGWNKL